MKTQRKPRLVCGVGINDAGYPVNIYEYINGKQTALWRCHFYGTWRGMLERCYSRKVHVRQPTYAGCAVVREWHSFSAFRAWMVEQDWEGKELDKDILSPGNKVYGPDSCVFVSSQVNNFIIDSGSVRGEWPIGVVWHKRDGKFQASCSNPLARKLEHLGYFSTPESAHEAWRKRKHEHALRYADMQTDLRIAEALRNRYADNG